MPNRGLFGWPDAIAIRVRIDNPPQDAQSSCPDMPVDFQMKTTRTITRYLKLPLLRSPRSALHQKLRRLLPRPFRRGEGRGEGLLGVVCPAVLSVARFWIVLLAAKLVTSNAVGGESMLAPALKAIEAGDFGGEAVTRAQLDQCLPPSKPHPFGQREHVVLQLDGEKKPATRPAQMQWISQPWNGENAQMPYLVYLPEKDRVLMLVQCRQPIHSAFITSADHGETWSARRWLSVDTNGQPNSVGLGLTCLGDGKLLAFPEDLKALWTSSDYGQTWKSTAASEPGSERYAWDPLLVVRGASGQIERVAQGCWKPTGVAWGSPDAPYSQAYFRSSADEGQTWSEAAKVPQWLGVNEVSMIVAANGDWVAACRIDYPKRFARFQFDHYGGLGVSISKDRGKSWSDVKRLYEWGRHHPSMVLLPDKRILMTYVVRLGYPNNAQGLPQFGVEAVISSDNGRTWDFGHRYVLATWAGTLKDERSWFCSVQSTSTVRLPDGTLLTAFGTGFNNIAEATRCKMDVALTKWRLE